MARRATLRASDADRERVAERLRHAAGEGRMLDPEELEERLEACSRPARTGSSTSGRRGPARSTSAYRSGRRDRSQWMAGS